MAERDVLDRVVQKSIDENVNFVFAEAVGKDGSYELSTIKQVYNARYRLKKMAETNARGAPMSTHLGDAFAAMETAVSDPKSCVQMKVTRKGNPPGMALYTDGVRTDMKRCLAEGAHEEFILRE